MKCTDYWTTNRNYWKQLTTALAVAGVVVLPACAGFDLGDPPPGGANALFDLRMLVVPSPGELARLGAEALSESQALCADGTDASDRAQALVDEMNAAVANDRALLEALASVEGVSEQPTITTYEVEADGRVMVVEDVSLGDSHAITGEIDGEEVFEAAVTNGGAAGSLTYGELEVAWLEEDGVLKAARQFGELDQAVILEEARVRIAVDDGNGGEVTAGWNATAGVIVDDSGPACFEGDEQCDVACSPELIDELSASLDDV